MFKLSKYLPAMEGRVGFLNLNNINLFDIIFVKLLFHINMVLSGGAIGFLLWNFIAYLKSMYANYYLVDSNAWTGIFYNPHEASLFNYIVLCLGTFLYGMFFFFRIRRNRLSYMRKKMRTLGNRYPLLLLVSSSLFFVFLNEHWDIRHRLLMSFYLLFILCIPIKIRNIKRIFDSSKDLLPMCLTIFMKYKVKLWWICFILLLCAISFEPLTVIKGPPYIINEYSHIYSDTKINNSYINNEVFLNAVKGHQSFVDGFIRANELEYEHQISTRGPFNHIGHILNPLNEYTSGKAHENIYMQYGWGNTLLYKWTMDLLGGLSLHNYYKCYGFYVVYVLLFAGLLLYLFKRSVFVLNALAVYAISFFSLGYTAFIIAPGIIPSIRLFDAAVVIFLLLYLRRKNLVYILSAVILVLISIYLNRNFGFILLISLWAACLPYLWAHKREKQMFYPLLAIMALPLPFSLLLCKETASANSMLYYFLTGYFSFSPEPTIVFLTIVYLVLSYYFLFLIRKQTHELKYIFIFAFIYSQGLLAYYYWSGYINHLLPVLPFIGFEILLMFYIIQESVIKKGVARTVFNSLVMVGTAVLAMFAVDSMNGFYESKRVHTNYYDQHRLYYWNFDRAKVVTTINPEPFRESIELIHKYSPKENAGIYILSVYDNVIPFLAKRYSLMPFFEMQWYIITPKERIETISKLKQQKPDYLFVDNNIGMNDPDLWELNLDYTGNKCERKAGRGRRLELASIFTAVSDHYEKIEDGVLLSVYKRKPSGVLF